MDGQYFVGPHPVYQFMARIAPLAYNEARTAILAGLATTIYAPKPLRNGQGIMLRVRRPYAFRAVIVRGEGPLPAVATVLKSRKCRRQSRGR
jgi:hypothetical protein